MVFLCIVDPSLQVLGFFLDELYCVLKTLLPFFPAFLLQAHLQLNIIFFFKILRNFPLSYGYFVIALALKFFHVPYIFSLDVFDLSFVLQLNVESVVVLSCIYESLVSVVCFGELCSQLLVLEMLELYALGGNGFLLLALRFEEFQLFLKLSCP